MSNQNIRTFLIMSHGSWPEKQIETDAKGRQYASKGNLYIDLKGYNSTTHTLGGNYTDIGDTKYTIPKKTRLFTTTNYGNLAVACPKYDDFIKKYIGKYGTNIFTSPRLIDSLPQKYEFIKNSRLYTDGNKIVDIDITFEEDEESWNIWEKNKFGLSEVPNLDLTEKYRLSDLINYLTSTKENDGIAVPNQTTKIILHCCMPNLNNWSWNDDEYNKLENKINIMMTQGLLNMKIELQRNKFSEAKTRKHPIEKKIRLRSGVIKPNNQIMSNIKERKKERLLKKGWISYYENKKKNTMSYKPQRKKPNKLKIGIKKTRTKTRMKK